MSTEIQLREAERWTGSTVRIRSIDRGGRITIPAAEHNSQVTTRFHGTSQFVVEAIPDMPGVVAFRLINNGLQVNDSLYLTNIMYGDEHRQNVAEMLAKVPDMLPDCIPLIVDFSVGRPTGSENFEGAGFNYNPMTVQRGPPNKLQMFRLEPGIGVRSLFGTYWRSEWWNRVVSQSPHLRGDERWYFERANEGMDSDSEYSGSGSSSGSGSGSESEDYEGSDSETDSGMDG